MSELLALLAIVLAFVLYDRARKKIRDLDQRLGDARSRLSAIERQVSASTPPPRVARPTPPPLPAASEPVGVTPFTATPATPEQPAARAAAAQAVPPETSERRLPTTAASPAAAPPALAIPAPAPRQPPPWRRALAQNWTGILGAVITVAGVGFFGVYASFKLGPVGRFLLIDGFAALLFLGSRWLQRFEAWRPFGSWLQAIAGAIVLLACLGASAFERLRFIGDPTLGLLVLCLGIGVNLLFAYVTPQQAV